MPVLLYSEYDNWLGACRGAPDCLPTVYFLEEYEVSGQEELEQVEYSLAPDFARITHANGEVLMDVQRDLLAHYSSESKEWRLHSLQGFESQIDSTTGILLDRLAALRGERGLPVFEPSGEGPRVANVETTRYHLYVETETLPGAMEEVEEEIWVASTELLAWSETYPTYERIVRLYDQMWRDVPIERPEGVVVHTTMRRRPLKRTRKSGDDWEVEKATIVSVEYRCMPAYYFQLPPEAEAQAGKIELLNSD